MGPTHQVIPAVARDTRGIEPDGRVTPNRSTYHFPKATFRTTPSSSELSQTRRSSCSGIRPGHRIVRSKPGGHHLHARADASCIKQWPSASSGSLRPASLSIIGMLGLLLASMGIFGTVSYIVSVRTREVGIRIALGAPETRHPRLDASREHGRPVLAASLVGVTLSVGVSYLLRGILYGINIVDGTLSVGVSFSFLAIALFATYLPSRRAMRVDPAVALRVRIILPAHFERQTIGALSYVDLGSIGNRLHCTPKLRHAGSR